jgi:hypothetical protein
MYTGSLIDDLMQAVERTEQHAHAAWMREPLEPMVKAFPVWSTYMYEWPVEQTIGVQ